MKIDYRFALSILMILSGLIASAKPADPRPKTFVQPDGQTITVQIRGDERQHFFLSEDGHLLARVGDAFYYGDVDSQGRTVSSGILASSPEKRSAQANEYLRRVDTPQALSRLAAKAPKAPGRMKAPASTYSVDTSRGLMPDSDFPLTGSPKVLVVLVEFKDKDFTLEDPHDYFYRMLREPGFSLYGGTGSVSDYFTENSLGEFTPQFDLYGPVKLPKTYSYYGNNDWWGNDEHPEEMIVDACSLLDEEVDFSQYDNDGDGKVDNVYVFYAGPGEASGGSASTVWPHAWFLESSDLAPCVLDGVRLDRYACSNEWESYRPDGIGTFVHEFSHVMGLPDLYATTYTSSFTPGAWSALDYGPYNNNGCTPPAYSAFERYALGWLQPRVLDGAANISLPHIIDNEACIAHTSKPTEYFLFENRQQQGWDAYIPGHGMLVWHIDYRSDIWLNNNVNNTPSHQYVDIVEADETRDESSRGGDAFPGTRGVTSFTHDSRPVFAPWSGEDLGLPITEIAEAKGFVSFCVAGGHADIDAVSLLEPSDIRAASFVLSWQHVEGADSYAVSLRAADDDSGDCLPEWDRRDVGYTDCVTVSGLEPNTEYCCWVTAMQLGHPADPSELVMVTTTDPTFDYYAPVATEALDVTDHSFVASWLPMQDAQAYYINVYALTQADLSSAVCDFTGGVSAMPEGWSTNTTFTYANTGYFGAAAPALRMSTQGNFLESPVFDSDVVAVSFWHRGARTDEQNGILVQALVDGEYVDVQRVAVTNDEGGLTSRVSDFPAGARAVRLVYDEVRHTGAVAVDDVEIVWGTEHALELMPQYTMVPADVDPDGPLTYLVSDLEPLTTYAFTVTASDGVLLSRESDHVMVTTAQGAGISDVAVAASVRVSGSMVVIDAAPRLQVEVYDVLGRKVASALTGASGKAAVTLAPGAVYMVRVGAQTLKLKI